MIGLIRVTKVIKLGDVHVDDVALSIKVGQRMNQRKVRAVGELPDMPLQSPNCELNVSCASFESDCPRKMRAG